MDTPGERDRTASTSAVGPSRSAPARTAVTGSGVGALDFTPQDAQQPLDGGWTCLRPAHVSRLGALHPHLREGADDPEEVVDETTRQHRRGIDMEDPVGVGVLRTHRLGARGLPALPHLEALGAVELRPKPRRRRAAGGVIGPEDEHPLAVTVRSAGPQAGRGSGSRSNTIRWSSE